MGISNNLAEISPIFEVYGLMENKGLVAFELNKNYSAFVIVKK